jgi:hypothetical protein
MGNFYTFDLEVNYYNMPHNKLDDVIGELSLNDFRLLHSVHSFAQRKNESSIMLSMSQIYEHSKLHKVHIAKARENLVKFGLLIVEQDSRKQYTYTIPNPISGQPVRYKAVNGYGDPIAIYDYTDADGKLVYQALRYKNKKFNQRKPHPTKPDKWIYDVKDCKPLPYRLQELKNASVVAITEGEEDVKSILSMNLMDADFCPIAATTRSGGVGKWTPEQLEHLRGKQVLLVGDNDDVGKDYMHTMRMALEGIAESVSMVHIPSECKDISEYLKGHSADEFTELLEVDWLASNVQI